MCDLSSPSRDQTHTPCIGRQSPNHWTTREVAKSLPPLPGSFLPPSRLSFCLSAPPSISLSLEQQLDPPQKERLTAALAEMDQQLRKLADTPCLCQPMEPGDEEVCGSRASAWHPGHGAVPSVSESLCGFGVKMVLLLRPLIWPPVNTRLC